MRRLIVIAAASGTLAVAPTAASGPIPTASAPQGRIAYAPRFYPKDDRITDNWEIFTLNAAGGRSVNLTRHPCDEYAPAWSHDGHWIAFVCKDGLVVMRHDRRARRTVVRLPRQRMDDVAWSPDDRQLAFVGNQGIRVVNADGKGLRRLSRGRDSSPTWSRDGQTIAFSRELRGVSHVLQMRADGTGHRRIAARADRPAFSPDGATIAFLRNGSIWLMDADGARPRRLPRAGSGHVDLAWSPDGHYLAYQYQHYELHVIARDGTRGRTMPSYGADISGIDWGPNPPS
jgi:Tol biopolymer transport system component